MPRWFSGKAFVRIGGRIGGENDGADLLVPRPSDLGFDLPDDGVFESPLVPRVAIHLMLVAPVHLLTGR
jgi:hypothetical protein